MLLIKTNSIRIRIAVALSFVPVAYPTIYIPYVYMVIHMYMYAQWSITADRTTNEDKKTAEFRMQFAIGHAEESWSHAMVVKIGRQRR